MVLHLIGQAKTQTIEKSIYCFPELTPDWDCAEITGARTQEPDWTTREANMSAQLMLIVIDAINKLEKKPFNCSNIPWFIAHCNLLVKFIDPLCFHHFYILQFSTQRYEAVAQFISLPEE